MALRFFCRKVFTRRDWCRAGILGLVAAIAGCSDHGAATSTVQDGGSGGQGGTAADSATTGNHDGGPEAGRGGEAGADLRQDPDTQAAIDSGSTSTDGRGGSDAGPGTDASTDVGRLPDSLPPGDSGSTRSDTPAGPDAGQNADTRADIGRTSDTPAAGDSGSTSSDTSGASSDAGSGADSDPCAGGTTYAASTSAKATINGYGWVLLTIGGSNKVVAFDTTMIVPDTPPASGTLFLWPGLQPLEGGANFAVLNNGVLQPVLTWGPTCAPNSPAQSYKSWWISGQYVNTNITSSSSNYAAYNGCHGGPGMNVAVNDTLDMHFALSGTDWVQTVTNRRNSQSVTYSIDMLGQAQGMAEFVIEEYSSKPTSDVIFTSSVITFASAAKSACQPSQRGTNDYFSAPRASADGLRCCIDKVILRAEGVAATSPNSH